MFLLENLLEKIYNNNEFINIIQDILENETVKQMKNYRQHHETSCFDHCLIASYYCYIYLCIFKFIIYKIINISILPSHNSVKEGFTFIIL